LIDWLVFNVQRAFFQLYSRAQGFTPVRPAFSFSQKFWKFYTLLNNNQVKLSQAIIPFMVPELCPLNNWKISILWFLCYNLSFPQPNILKFLHHDARWMLNTNQSINQSINQLKLRKGEGGTNTGYLIVIRQVCMHAVQTFNEAVHQTFVLHPDNN
jgi:hypothetical protein